MTPLKSTSSAASRSTRRARLAAVAMLLGGAAVGALAQYKIVGPDGQVTYTDKPPTPQDIRPSKGAPAQPGSSGLPFETRQAMTKYPVSLFTAKNCPGCDQARQSLRQRGVPFNEYSVATNDDYAALQARFGGTSVPVVLIGSQSMKGYSSNDLQSYLDAAGYPAQAHLVGYSWAPAAPLAPRNANAPAAAANDPDQPAQAASAPTPLPPPPSTNGIQF
jgi:glutaredoxin